MTETIFQPIRIMLVANHPMLCRALETFLMVFDHLRMVGRAESNEAAFQLCAEVLPDVILMDMDMPGIDGAAATRAILQKTPEVGVIALTGYKECHLIKGALEAGMIGYLLKDVSADQIDRAICAAASGRATISAEAVQALIELPDQSPEPDHELIECEPCELALMINGLNTPQIAENLIINSSCIEMRVPVFS